MTIQEVYEKYKHYAWSNGNLAVGSCPNTAELISDLWQAIKEEVEGKK